ncbi:hypothetical protein DH2020_043491 [Rehmannia glutinosa]|uniref:Haloacid dehalogenase-like hydrolase domain-containing protein n=1 Tax=Rehmannia glutinosa TaxID=99300 RepID=A0ABR0UJF4_REHGL
MATSPSSTVVNAAITTKASLRGVVFDMDGTLTVPVIDFPAMYRAVLGEEEYVKVKSKNPSGIDILHLIETWSPDKQKRAYQIIADFEKQGLDRLEIMPAKRGLKGVAMEDAKTSDVPKISAVNPLSLIFKFNFVAGASELCGFLDSRNIRRGLITRNVKEAVDLFHQRFGMIFSPALSREFRPYKPDPAPLLHICSNWDVQPNEVMMIGDSLKDDVACGKRAGAFTCLLDETGRYDSPEYQNVEFKPDYKVSSLVEIHKLLEKDFNLTPCPNSGTHK